MISTGMMKAKMNTQIFRRFSQYHAGWENVSVQSIEPGEKGKQHRRTSESVFHLLFFKPLLLTITNKYTKIY